MILNFARHKIYNEQDKWSCNVTLREEDAQTLAKHNQLEKIEAIVTNEFLHKCFQEISREKIHMLQ